MNLKIINLILIESKIIYTNKFNFIIYFGLGQSPIPNPHLIKLKIL